MRRIAKLLLNTLATMLSITVFTFILVYLAPSDAAEQLLLSGGLLPTDATIDALRHDLGLDRSLPAQYVSWLIALLHGDMGVSFSNGMPVWDTMLPAAQKTLVLAFWSFAATVAISLPLGVICAMHRDQAADRIIRAITYIVAAIPTFVLGVALLYFFAERNQILPSIANNHYGGLIMPTAVLASSSIVWMVRQIRTIMLEKMDEPYVIGLRARGIDEWTIMLLYVLKSAMVPIVTSYGICFGSMLGGATIVEQIFTWSGLGRVVLHAISMRDYPLVLGFALWIAFIYCIINIVIDLLYGVFDPRIRKEGAGNGKSGGWRNKRPHAPKGSDTAASADAAADAAANVPTLASAKAQDAQGQGVGGLA